MRDWKTLDQYSASIHRYITFCVSGATQRDPVSAQERWLWRKYYKPSLLKFIVSAETVTVDDALSATRSLDRYHKDACDKCMPKGKYMKIKKPAYWWTKKIYNMREVFKRTRLKYKRGRHQPIEKHQKLQEEFKLARKQLNLAIRLSKKASWKKLYEEVETDTWGPPYKLVEKKLIGRRPIPGLSTPGRVDSTIDVLFPKESVILWSPRTKNHTFPKVICAGILDLCNKILRWKAPGPKGVLDLVVKEVAINRPDIIRDVFKVCIENSVFPHSWKVAKLFLLRKGYKPLDNPSSYRLICLLSMVGKLSGDL